MLKSHDVLGPSSAPRTGSASISHAHRALKLANYEGICQNNEYNLICTFQGPPSAKLLLVQLSQLSKLIPHEVV